MRTRAIRKGGKKTKEKKRMMKTTKAQISSVGYGNGRRERERCIASMTRLVLVPKMNEEFSFFFSVLYPLEERK
jgi:hypothetical protein